MIGIMRELVHRDSQNSEWRRDLGNSLEKIGNVYEAFGNLEMAFSVYEEGLEIKRSLAKIDSERIKEWRWDLSAGLLRAGDNQARLTYGILNLTKIVLLLKATKLKYTNQALKDFRLPKT